MCHVLGFVNRAGEGSCGVELWADEYLRGSPGASVGQVDARRRPTRQGKMQIIPPLPGADVHLTLNQHVQFIVENALDEAVAANQAKGAWAIVQEVRSGRILAMASRPGFNLNGFSEVDPSLWLNRAIGYVYEPGSVFKAATISAALEEKTVTPDTVFDCENGAWLYNRRVLRDFHPYGHLTVADGVKKSSNILAAKVSLTLGEERLYRRLRAFGIGQKTGIDLPGEEKGLLRPPSAWSDLCATRIAIGQSVAVTALQMLNVYCTIANEGRMMKPYLVDRIVAADGSVQRQCRPEVVRQVISRRTAATVCRLLARVTEEGGTGHAARIDGYTVAGKTGTAQKAQRGGYSDSDYVASFVGFFPAESPVIGIIVVVDEPQPKHTGGVVAAPVFSVIASQVARCVDVAAPEPLLARTGR
jgi:cell division protein FtsI (penicillin-binding protein 3)